MDLPPTPASAPRALIDFGMNATEPGPERRSWSYLNTPLRVYLIVMLPICALMGFLITVPQITWIRVAASAVIGVTFYGMLRGYVRRVVATPGAIEFRTLGSVWRIPWDEVRRIDEYIPSGGVNGPKYVYITRHDRAPHGRWELDRDTFQLQSRPGLLDELRAAKSRP